jgi:cation diffusion facilitator CzcD-associated flavoprotein CzcO
VFEQREVVGGVWNATPGLDSPIDDEFAIPRTQPSEIPPSATKDGEFLSPIYDELDTNIPHQIMNYCDQKFPQGSSLFPQHRKVLDYLQQYAEDIKPLLRLGVQVLDVVAIENSMWSIRTKSIRTPEITTAVYDAVVVSSGHYDDPFIPDIMGLKAWNAAHPGIISHSKYYRRPEIYKNKVSLN